MVGQPAGSGNGTVSGPGGLTFQLPAGGGGSTSSLYLQGSWSGQSINPAGLPFPVTTDGQGTATGEQVVKAFANASPAQIAQIQQALLLSGFYTANYTPEFGVVRTDDIAAFGKAVTVAGQSSQPVGTYILTAAAVGARQGAQSAQNQARASATVHLPSPVDLGAALDSAFSAEGVGRRPSAKERAAFAAAYRQVAISSAQAAVGPQAGTTDQTALPSLLPNIDRTAAPTGMRRNEASPGDQPVQQPVISTPTFGDQVGNLLAGEQAATPQAPGQTVGGVSAQTDAPSVSGFADEYVRNHYNDEASAHQALHFYNLMFSMLGSGGH